MYETDSLNVALLNVCGLKTKLKVPDFGNFAQKFEIVCLTETKLDEVDTVDLPGYVLFRKDRIKKKRASGGVAFCANIVHKVNILNVDDEDTCTL